MVKQLNSRAQWRKPMPSEYAPYHRMPEFKQGRQDYGGKLREYENVQAQAYDRGLEFAMRLLRWRSR
jgi:hypothetical protein